MQKAPLVKISLLVALVLVGCAYGLVGWNEDGVRVVVRWTAKIGVVFFAAAFSAGPLRSLWPNPATRWLLVNRRGMGLAFAVVHTLHLLALIALGTLSRPFVEGLDAITLLGGGLAYAFMYAMVATSNDASVRRLGMRRWKRLHTVGGWYIWFIFAQSYLPRAAGQAEYVPFALLLAVVAALRCARHFAKRRQPSKASGSLAST